MNLLTSLRKVFGKNPKDVASYLLDKNRLLVFLFLFFITAIFLVNGLHESYPDEFDNIMGGWYSLHGKLIYRDWFTHHGPVAYWVASFIEIFSGQSFVRFRIIYSLFLVVLTFGGYVYLKRSLGFEKTKFYLAFISILSIAATYFWAHMLLADSLSGFLLIPVFGLILLKSYYGIELSIRDFIFISAVTSMAILSSLTYAYLIGGIYIAVILMFFFFPKRKVFLNKNNIKPFVIIAAPFLIFFIYLIITGSLQDYLYQAISFNQKFYIYNYPRPEGTTFINPIRFAIVIAQEFHNNFSSLLIQVKDFAFTFPFNITLAVVNASFLIFLILKKKYALVLFVLFCFIYSNGRSNPWTSKETDYQSAVYIMISLFNMALLIPLLYEDLKKDLDYPKKLILSAIFVLVCIYSFFNGAFLLRKFSYKAYNKYMGSEAMIYDRPKIAPIINSIVDKDEYALIGPFEFEELFYMNVKVPTKYQILIPGFGKSPEIQKDMLSELSKNKPKVIYFDKRYFILGSSPEMHGKFFLGFLDKNYITLLDYDDGVNKYRSKIPIDGKLDLETKLFIDKEKVTEVIEKMLQQNLIESY